MLQEGVESGEHGETSLCSSTNLMTAPLESGVRVPEYYLGMERRSMLLQAVIKIVLGPLQECQLKALSSKIRTLTNFMYVPLTVSYGWNFL